MQCPRLCRPWLPLLVTAASLLLAGIAGYAQIFSTLAPYDDEGYVMISLQSYLQGHPLYDATFTQYGPAYYQLQGLLHRTLDLPVTQDVNRLKTLAVWLLASALSGWIVQRATGSGIAGWLALTAAALQLDKLCLEPGHPQELCLLMVLVSIAAAQWLREGAAVRNLLVAAVMGVAVGVTATTKINVGVLVGLATTCTLVWLAAPSRWQKGLALLAAAAAAGLPLLLCGKAWESPATAAFPLLLAGSTLPVALRLRRWPAQSRLPITCLAACLACGAIIAAAVLLISHHQGTSWAGIGYGLIGQHLGFAQSFYTPVPMVLAAPVLGLAAAGWMVRGRGSLEGCRQLARRCAELIVPVLVAGFALATFVPLKHGLEPRGLTMALTSFGPLLVWALVGQPGPGSMGRVHLTWMALLQPLIAYPTAGTQVELGDLPLLLAMIILAADGWRAADPSAAAHVAHEAHATPPVEPTAAAHPGRRRAGRESMGIRWNRPMAGIAAALLAVLVVRDVYFPWRRAGLVPLEVAGAERLRLPEAQARHEQALVDYLLAARPETFLFADHGHNRFYFWTGIAPPTAKNATFWPYMLDHRAQQEIIRALESHQRVGVVGMEGGERLLPHSPGPLRAYLEAHYRVERQLSGWTIWTRREALSRHCPSSHAPTSTIGG